MPEPRRRQTPQTSTAHATTAATRTPGPQASAGPGHAASSRGAFTQSVRDLQPQGGPASPLPSEGAGERAPSLLPGESEAIAGYAKTAAVQAMPDGSLQVHGVRVGPLSADHARALAGLLQTVSPTELRSAKASGRRVSFGGTDFEFDAADASAMGKCKAEEAAVAVAQALDGMWSKGVHTESGRRVLPRNISPGALYAFAKAVVTEPGRAAVEGKPGQVTVPGLRGVNPEGISDPKVGA
ncbi:MAG: hypothetical protein EXR76_18710 [Myxococcales bacterium]|nr:hypothetical protein [Myxococcales bacterium]